MRPFVAWDGGAVLKMDARLMWVNRSFISFDTETSGLDFRKDRIIQAAIACFRGDQHVWSFEWLLNTKIKSDPEALAVHNISDEQRIAEGTDAKTVVTHLVAMFRRSTQYNSPIVAFNSPFDFSMLRAELARFRIDYDFNGVHVIDPLVIDRHFQKNVPVFTKPWMRQYQMAGRYGVPYPTHNALDDAVCAGRIALAQSLHYSGLRNVQPSILHKKQEIWFRDFKSKVNKFADKKNLEFSLPDWPFGDKNVLT